MTPPPLPLSPLLMTKCMVVLLTKGLEGSRGRDRALIYVFLVGRCLGKTQWRPSAQSLCHGALGALYASTKSLHGFTFR